MQSSGVTFNEGMMVRGKTFLITRGYLATFHNNKRMSNIFCTSKASSREIQFCACCMYIQELHSSKSPVNVYTEMASWNRFSKLLEIALGSSLNSTNFSVLE